MIKIYEGTSVGLGVLAGLDVDVLRVTYALVPLRPGRRSDGETGPYDMIALSDSDITYSRALECFEAAISLAAGKMEGGHSIVCPRTGDARTEALSIHLDWDVQRYYNQSDLLPDGGAFRPHGYDMFILFATACGPKERIEALRLAHCKLREVGLPKGVVAVGRERYVAVCETDDGHDAIEWSVRCDPSSLSLYSCGRVNGA